MSKEDFGRWLRVMRIRQGLSQQDLANELDVDQTTVSRLERGAQGMSGPLAAAIARVFGLAVDDVWQQVERAVDDVPNELPAPRIITGGPAPTIDTGISRGVMDVARRIEALPAPERRRVMLYVRSILSAAEDEAEREAMLAGANNGQ